MFFCFVGVVFATTIIDEVDRHDAVVSNAGLRAKKFDGGVKIIPKFVPAGLSSAGLKMKNNLHYRTSLTQPKQPAAGMNNVVSGGDSFGKQVMGATQKEGSIPNVVHTFSRRCGNQLRHQREWNRLGFMVKCYDNQKQLEECAKVGITFNVRHLQIHVADVCRFAVLYTYGGLYADVDVQPNPGYKGSSLQDLVDNKYGILLGYEANMKSSRDRALFPTVLPRSLCMWIMGSQPRATAMLDVAKQLMQNIRLRRNGESLEHYVHLTTGPTAITQFFDKKYKDLSVQPVTLFGCGQHHSSAGQCNSPNAFSRHFFQGVWRDDVRFMPAKAKAKAESGAAEAKAPSAGGE